MSKRIVLDTAWIIPSGDGARLVKARDGASQQLPEDPFNYGEGQSGLVNPPYGLEALAGMLENNALHYRACKQKASDVAGRGFTIRPKDPKEKNQAAEDAWGEFVASVEDDARGDESFKERVVMAHEDYEAIGWAVLEVSRRGDGAPDGLWHVPAQTVRAHRDGRRFAQMRSGKLVWFKRFGLEGTVDRRDGGWSDRTARTEFAGNELLVIRNYTPRSSYYGLPDHIPALAAMAGWKAQAEFNVLFFNNNAVPSYAVVVEGAELSPQLEETIKDHFRQIKGDPHRTIIIPVPGGGGDEGSAPKLRFERLSVDVKDASFRLYKQDNALEICIAHGIPPYRVGWPLMGSLGGATAEEMTQIYNDAVIQPRQETWEQRLTRALLGAKGLNHPEVVLKAAELDVRNETRDIEKARALWEMDSLTPNEIRSFFGYDPRDDGLGDAFHDVIEPPPGGGMAMPPGVMAKRWTVEVRELAQLRKRIEEIVFPGEQAVAA